MRPGALLQLLLEACLWFQLQKMVKCIVPSCHKKSDIERDVSFFPLPAIKRKNKALFQPSRKRNWLSCKDLSKTDLSQVGTSLNEIFNSFLNSLPTRKLSKKFHSTTQPSKAGFFLTASRSKKS